MASADALLPRNSVWLPGPREISERALPADSAVTALLVVLTSLLSLARMTTATTQPRQARWQAALGPG